MTSHLFAHLVGRKYGLLRITAVHPQPDKTLRLDCTCACGKPVPDLSHQDVISGVIRDCGCLPRKRPLRRRRSNGRRRHDLTGKTFGQWTVLRHTTRPYGALGPTLWRCRCVCGVERDVPAGNLKNGSSQSCGCYRRRRLDTKASYVYNTAVTAALNAARELVNAAPDADFDDLVRRLEVAVRAVPAEAPIPPGATPETTTGGAA
jgi:hypothetical protein